jgi:hypothetical protein
MTSIAQKGLDTFEVWHKPPLGYRPFLLHTPAPALFLFNGFKINAGLSLLRPLGTPGFTEQWKIHP